MGRTQKMRITQNWKIQCVVDCPEEICSAILLVCIWHHPGSGGGQRQNIKEQCLIFCLGNLKFKGMNVDFSNFASIFHPLIRLIHQCSLTHLLLASFFTFPHLVPHIQPMGSPIPCPFGPVCPSSLIQHHTSPFLIRSHNLPPFVHIYHLSLSLPFYLPPGSASSLTTTPLAKSICHVLAPPHPAPHIFILAIFTMHSHS